MKAQLFMLMLSIGLIPSLSGQEVLIRENIQSWSECVSFGFYTQTINVGNKTGTVKLFNCSVAPFCPEEGSGSKGCLVMKAYLGSIELPELQSVSEISFQLASISKGKSVTLQKKNGNTWVDLVTFTNLSSPARSISFKVNENEPTVLRLTSSNSNIYIYDIEVKGTKQVSPEALAGGFVTTSTPRPVVQNK